MNRRDALRGIGAILGCAVTPSVANAVLAGYRTPPAGQAPRALTAPQAELLDALTEIIIPATDTPGAHGARVYAFIDGLLADIFTAAERDAFLAGLASVDERALADHGGRFLDATPARRIDVLRGLEEDAGAATEEGPRPFFPWLKELTLVGYYTSEIGASRELAYVHVAGRYDGDVPYAEIGKAYS